MNELTPYFVRENAEGAQELLLKLEQLHILLHTIHANIHPAVLDQIRQGMGFVNNYYSNQIESDGTHPILIEKACKEGVQGLLNDEAKKKLLALAYQDAQSLISNDHFPPDLVDRIKLFHSRFYGSSYLLEEQRYILDESTAREIYINPGEFRDLKVEVGKHVAPDPDDIIRLTRDFNAHYTILKSDLGVNKLFKAFAAHHRFMFIHPFLDGNGRTGRLLLDSMLKEIMPNAYGLWSISRGLAKNNHEYKAALAQADQPRQGAPHDGLGMRSERGLLYFVNFMTDTAIRELEFMKDKLMLSKLEERIKKYLLYTTETIPDEFKAILPRLLISGSIPKSEVHALIGCSDRTGRTIVSKLKSLGLLQETYDSKQAPLQLSIPTELLSYLFPDIVPAIHG